MSNKKIKNATSCKLDSIKFKSQSEKMVYKHLIGLGFNPQYEPTTFTLWKGFTPITPFYDKETPKQKEKRCSEGDNVSGYILVPKNSKIVGIRYTPDFYFNYKGIDVFIEVKGFENDVFYIKKKLFRYYLDQQFIQKGKRSIFFEIYTKKNLIQAIEILEDYAKSISKDIEIN